MRGAYAQTLFVEGLDDLGRQDCLELLHVGVLVPEVAEEIPASAYEFTAC